MSPTWLNALRAYATRTNATPASLLARRHLFDQLCAAHLRGLPNAQLHPDALAVLREVRWSLLREGTTADKAELLEHILRQYSQAVEKAMFAASTASRSPDSMSGSTDTQCKQSGRQQPVSKSNSSRTFLPQDRPPQHSNRGGSPLSDAQLSELSMLQPLLLEQVQCLVEAKVSDIPLSARHYRYPLRSPLLATVSPELPLLVLEELTQQNSALSPSSPPSTVDWEARVDCCVGLVAAGHVEEALALCGNDGSAFRAAMQRVVPLRRDGWRYAWALADAAPLSRILDDATAAGGSGSASLSWLRGVLEAVDMRHRAVVGARQPTAAGVGVSASADLERNDLFEWVDRLRRLLVQSSKRPLTGAEGQQQQQRVSATALRLVMDTYFSVCPAGRWRDAVGAVLELSGAIGGAPAATQAAAEGNRYADAVTMGRLMSMLQAAEQPWMVLLFFYGDSLALQVASAVSGSDSSTQPSGSDDAARWRVSDNSVRAKVEECVQAARDADHLTMATGTMLKERDKSHTAIYNHAMVALAATGHHTEAMLFYRTLPSLLVNSYTHWSVLRLFLRPTQDRRAASALRSSDNYNHCVHALRHLIQMSTAGSEAPDTRTPVSNTDNDEQPSASISFTRDQSSVWESMTLWAALRRDAETVSLCAAHAPAASRYAHPIALLSAAVARGDGWSAVQAQVRHMCAAPRTTLKELSLATAATASFFPRWPDGTAAAELPMRAELFDEVARSMARLVGRSQSRMDELLQLLVDYSISLRRRRRTPMTPQDEEAALDDILVKENILASTMDLARPRAVCGSDVDKEHQASDNDGAEEPSVWRTLVRVMASVAELQGLSAARAAPALVSAGVPAKMAIDLLPT
ncbi:hypothetical protein JIQ42_08030 [Leishmania sp. Namibia]|uniref:hypothetical protein n=1 Tax=Leishmania sp. Namibia TaxID=2802991 RepID=UPI001B5F9343|nr:hypothetical protein JIQ42_08030 [Leishmania sp. Namibia]